MKVSTTLVSLLLSCALGVAADKESAAQAALTAKTIQTMKAEIAAKPSRVLYAVEDALVMSEASACEIVKTAITQTSADAKLIGDIVYTAVSKAPSMSAVIVDCAVKCNPDASPEIKKALQRALGDGESTEESQGSGKAIASSGKETVSTGKQPVTSGKQPVPSAKEPVVTEEPEFLDFGLQRPGVGGLYFANPGGGNAGTTVPRTRKPDETSTDTPPRRRVHPPGGVSPTVLEPEKAE